MGREARCTARLGESVSEGKALLETSSLLFRGEFRLDIPFEDMRSVAVQDGKLTIAFSKGWAVFELGAQAEQWAERIRNPRSLLDKLGVRPGARVSVLGVGSELAELVRDRTALVTVDEPQEGSDLVFLGTESVGDLDRLQALVGYLGPGGAIWVVAPKGGREPTEAQVLAAGRSAGLVDTKVARFSDTHTAHRFSIPRARR